MTDNRAVDDLAHVRPLNARSVALSALLGTRPPRLASRSLVGLAELFEIAPGTMRTALSRMTSTGELVSDAGRYALGPSLRERQASQDRPMWTGAWDGTWHTVVAADDQRELTDRRWFRSMLANFRFGEFRPDIWMRPANEPAPPADERLLAMTGTLGGHHTQLVGELWDLDRFKRAARSLDHDIATLVDQLDWDDVRSIPDGFLVSAATIRFLRAEPRLPAELAPPGWPVEALRRRFAELEQLHRPLLARFLAETSGRTRPS